MNIITIKQSNRFRIVVFNVLLIITLGLAGTVHAQETTKKNRLYKTWIKKTNSKTRLVGVLYQVENGKLQISKNQLDIQNVYAHEIDKIKLRRTGSIGRGALIGFVSGLVTGALIGLISGDDSCNPNSFCILQLEAEDKALMGGVSLGVVGAIVGAVIGSLQIKIPINGSTERFKANKIRLNEYSYKGSL